MKSENKQTSMKSENLTPKQASSTATKKESWSKKVISNRWNMPETIPTSSGSRWEPQCQIETDPETGRQKLIDIGAEDRYAKIQEQLEPTKIENILRRFQEGDASALARAHGLYMDISDMPTSLIEANQKLEQVKQSFEKLPTEIKEAFDNDPMVMLAEIENGNGLEKLQKLTQIKTQETQKEVKPNESEQQ